MKSTFSASSSEIAEGDIPLKVPRVASLEHRLQHARDADGQPLPLIDELLFFLDDPPPGTTDRWQQGADLCESHGIPTSRMSVWRFYRAHILEWRREQAPVPPEPPADPRETEWLHQQAQHLAAQRVVDFLNDPRLTPAQLVGLLQHDNQRRKIELARDQFKDRLEVRSREETRERYRRIDEEARKNAMYPAHLEFLEKTLGTLRAIPSHPTP